MATTATLKLDDKEYPLPILIGTEGEKAIDTRKLRADSGYICYDQGYGNTGSCESAITYLDGDNGVLRHRGYPIEDLAQHSDFVETTYLIIYGELPNAAKRKEFGLLLRQNAAVETQMQRIFEGFPKDAPPMASQGPQKPSQTRPHQRGPIRSHRRASISPRPPARCGSRGSMPITSQVVLCKLAPWLPCHPVPARSR